MNEHIDGPWERGFGEFLGINSPRIKPASINMESVQPVIDVSSYGNFLTEKRMRARWLRGSLGNELEDVSSDNLVLVSYGDRGAPSTECCRLEPGEVFVPFSVWYQFTLPYGFRLVNPNRMFHVDLQTMYAHEEVAAWYTCWSASHETRDDNDQYPTRPGGYSGTSAGYRTMLSNGHIPMPLVFPPCHHVRLLVQTHGDPDTDPSQQWLFTDVCDWQVWCQGLAVPMGGPIPRFW